MNTRDLFVNALEDDIWFIHVRLEPTKRESRKQIKDAIEQAHQRSKKLEFFSIVVTLPNDLEPLNSRPWRYQFERMVVDGGGQLCFVDYDGDPGELDRERDFREELIDEKNVMGDGEYSAWGTATHR